MPRVNRYCCRCCGHTWDLGDLTPASTNFGISCPKCSDKDVWSLGRVWPENWKLDAVMPMINAVEHFMAYLEDQQVFLATGAPGEVRAITEPVRVTLLKMHGIDQKMLDSEDAEMHEEEKKLKKMVDKMMAKEAKKK